MIPINEEEFNNSEAERKVYNSLNNLSDDYYVFHSIRWASTNIDGTGHRGESDFLVFNKKLGFLAIEVKGGGIEYKAITKQWLSHTGQNTIHLRRSPLIQAQDSCNEFENRYISRSNNPYVSELPIKPIVWFPDIDSMQSISTSDYQPSITLTRSSLANPEEALRKAFAFYRMTPIDHDFTSSELRDIIELFAKDFKIVPSLASTLSDRDEIFLRLTNEQSSLLDYLEEQPVAAIRGLSGTGKTLIAIELAKRLPKDEPILFLVFNNLLRYYLREKYQDELPNVTFANLHELRAKVKRNSSINATSDEITEFLINDFTPNYRHVIIDEAQDFEYDHLEYIKDLLNGTGGYFYLFYDDNQLVNAKSDEQKAKAERLADWLKSFDCRLVLHKNCRNTIEISDTAYAAILSKTKSFTKQVHGELPILINCAPNSLIDAIAGQIRHFTQDLGLTRSQIVILTTRTIEKSQLANVTSIKGYTISQNRVPGKILFSTVRKYKGCESDAVILIEVNSNSFLTDSYRKAFYVGASRAKHYLSIIANLTSLDMYNVAKNLGATKEISMSNADSCRKLLEETLHVKIEDFDN